MDKKSLLLTLILLFHSGLLCSQTADETTLFERVEQGEADGMAPEEITRELVEAGFPAARVAYAVASGYANCNATFASVAMASWLRPVEADAVVTSVAQLTGCGCSANTEWGAGRLDNRVRIPPISRPVELPVACGCLAAGVQAAVATAPDRADRIVKAAIDAGQKISSPILDTVGRRAESSDDMMANIPSSNAGTVYRRKPDVCSADSNDLDEFEPAAQWTVAGESALDDLGAHHTECDRGDFSRPIISEFMTSDTGGGYIELFNGTDQAVSLQGEDIKLSVYYQGVQTRGHTIDLLGTILPGDTFVLAGEGASEAVLARADLIVPYLGFALGDTLNLHAGYSAESCGCTEAIATSAVRANPPDFILAAEIGAAAPQTEEGIDEATRQFEEDIQAGEDQSQQNQDEALAQFERDVAADVQPEEGDEVAEPVPMATFGTMIKTKILRFYGQLDDIQPGFVIDSVGEVALDPDAAPAELLATQLNRETAACSGDGNELDVFAQQQSEWDKVEQTRLDTIGSHWAACRTATSDLILSEVVSAEGDVGAVELYNPTPATIDLEDGGYVLEIYSRDSRTPEQVVPLSGIMAPRAAFVVAAEEAAMGVPQPPDLILGDLELDSKSAVILRKLLSPSALRCNSAIAQALAQLDTDSAFFVTPPGTPPVDPRSFPPRIDPLASPN